MNTTTSHDTNSGESTPASDSSGEPARSHVVARAERMRAVHVQGPGRDSCGLCLSAWPCPPRTWADTTLTP